MINEDWALDVKKYVPDADDAIIAGIVRYCGIALRKVDSSLVAFSDPKETARVRDGYCRKKLALTDSDAEVDAAIAAVGERMKADRTKNRVTVYYLLAEHFGKLSLFMPKAKAGSRATGAAAAAGAAAVAATTVGAAGAMASSADSDAPEAADTDGAGAVAAVGLMGAAGVAAASMDTDPPAVAMPEAAESAAAVSPIEAAATSVAEAATDTAEAVADGIGAAGAAAAGMAAAGMAAAGAVAASMTGSADETDRPLPAAAAAGAGWAQPTAASTGGGFSPGMLLGLLALVIGAGLLIWFLSSRAGDGSDAAAAGADAAATAESAAPAAPTPVPAAPPPEGAGVVATEVEGRPMVSVYFDTARANVAADFPTVVAPIKAWIDSHPGDRLRLSGFTDPRGNAAFNADLARRRAEAVSGALTAIGVPADRIDLERPAESSDATSDLAGARRVEITVVPAT